MKWIANLFNRKKDVSPLPAVALSKLQDWLDHRAQDPDFEERIKEIYGRMQSLAGKLKLDIEALRVAPPEENTPSRLLQAGLASREAILKQMDGLCEKLAPPGVDIGSAAAYHSRAVKALGNTVTKYGKAQRYMAALFPEQAERLRSDMNKLSSLLVELDSAIGQRQKEHQELLSLKEMASNLSDERLKIGVLGKEIADSEQELAELQAGEEKARLSLQHLLSSDKGQKAKALKEEMAAKRRELGAIEAEMAELAAPLNKALSRLLKQDSSQRLELQHGMALRLLSSRPAESTGVDFSQSLLELKRKMDSLGLKDKKRDKICQHIDRLIEDRSFENLVDRHNKITEKIKELERDILDYSHEFGSIEEELPRLQLRIAGAKERLDQRAQTLAAMDAKAARDFEDLKEGIKRVFGMEIAIDREK